jgi:hypothetical protein
MILTTLAAAFFGAAPACANVLINVDKSAQRMTVTVDGVVRYNWPVSTGRRGYATPSGNFRAFRMEEDHYSKEWDDAPMPHSIFFTAEGHAIHGSYEVKRLGRPASHGCVRLAPGNAATLFALVKEEGLSNTKVVLTGNAPSGAPAVAQHKVTPKLRRQKQADASYRRRGYAPSYYAQPPAYGQGPGWGQGGDYYRPRSQFPFE